MERYWAIYCPATRCSTHLAEGTQKEFGVIGVDGLLVIGNAGVVGLLVKMLTPVFHVRIIVFEDGEIRVGLVAEPEALYSVVSILTEPVMSPP